FAGIDQQNDAVDHAERALYFTAEIAVTRRIDDVDLGVVEEQRGVFRENGDAALAFQVVGVHHAFDDFLIGAENAALAQHGVDEGGLAVVDVRDDCDVANILTHSFENSVDTKIAAGTTSSQEILPCSQVRSSKL